MESRGIIGWLIIGFIIGGIARLLTPGRDKMGCLATSLLGIGGSFVGGFIGEQLFTGRQGYFGGYVRPGFLLSLAGAIILLLILRMVRRN
jgi:uncharacterized membrane protein YeaQ/YmgE (transglycosylase-associated protein family)